MKRLCKCGCGNELKQRGNESNTHFNKRMYLNQNHSNSHTQGDKNRARVKRICALPSCDEVLVKKYYPNTARYESNYTFIRRKYCNSKCSFDHKAEIKELTLVDDNICEICEKPIKRKKAKSGRMECASQYYRNRSHDGECAAELRRRSRKDENKAKATGIIKTELTEIEKWKRSGAKIDMSGKTDYSFMSTKKEHRLDRYARLARFQQN